MRSLKAHVGGAGPRYAADVLRRRITAVALVAATFALGGAAIARADSDPASDVLPVQDVFVPYQPRVSSSMQGTLRGVTRAAKKAGFPIKIAIIATAQDLGGVPDFFNKPGPYARFLGSEISFTKPQPLLVVMPNGMGTSKVPPKAAAAIAGMSVESGADGMARTAVKAVEKMAAATGHKLGSFKGSGGGGGSSTALIFVGPLILLVLVLVIVSYRRMGAEEEGGEADEDELKKEEEQPA
jgi:hypothetical protein